MQFLLLFCPRSWGRYESLDILSLFINVRSSGALSGCGVLLLALLAEESTTRVSIH